VLLEPEGTVTVKSWPVPLRLTVCVLPAAPLLLSVTVSAPVAEPLAVGVKVTLIVQDPDAATELEVEQVVPEVAAANGPVTARAVKVRLALPVLVTVTVCVALVVFTN
jgi:hypothetical protein